jgi:DNA-binding NarL/FixJ family response regulator
LNRDILVAILEDDLFARNWMALLMVRDWRTRMVGEFSTWAEVSAFFKVSNQFLDILILDVNQFNEKLSIREISHTLKSSQQKTKVLLTGINPEPRLLQQLDDDCISGYVLKSEIGYSLSWVISFVSDGYWVMTPGIQQLAHLRNFIPPINSLILDGQKTLPGFTTHEAEVARMAFIFSVGRRDLADELKISEQWSYGLVSELYKKMGLTDIISGEVDLFSYIGENQIIKRKFIEIIDQMGNSKKARDIETLAYHLLTMPEIV